MLEFIEKEECQTGEHGCSPENRSIEEHMRNGVIILDKWQGPTSRDVVSKVKKILGLNHAGHGGTLDPHVSGVLPITLENSCKIIPALQGVDKEYVGIMHLHKPVGDQELQRAIGKFIGEIKQKPPRKSAVARITRKRRIYEIEILDRNENDVCLRVKCEAGTYIRVLFHEIGQELDVGAHMKELRRIRAGPFTEDAAHKVQEVLSACELWKTGDEKPLRNIILTVEKAVDHLRKIYVKDSAIWSVAHGSPLFTTGICKIQKNISKSDLVAVFSLKNELIAIGDANMKSEEMITKKGIAVKTDRVIINKDVYSKSKR